jgi:hypothetical protein
LWRLSYYVFEQGRPSLCLGRQSTQCNISFKFTMSYRKEEIKVKNEKIVINICQSF